MCGICKVKVYTLNFGGVECEVPYIMGGRVLCQSMCPPVRARAGARARARTRSHAHWTGRLDTLASIGQSGFVDGDKPETPALYTIYIHGTAIGVF